MKRRYISTFAALAIAPIIASPAAAQQQHSFVTRSAMMAPALLDETTGTASRQPSASSRDITRPAGRLTGQIVDAETGEPVSVAIVEVEGMGVHAVSDTTGRFTISNIRGDTVALRIRRIGFAPQMLAKVVVLREDGRAHYIAMERLPFVKTAAGSRPSSVGQ